MGHLEYVIVGDTRAGQNRVLCVCGEDRELADFALFHLTRFPSVHDQQILKGYFNLRVESVSDDRYSRYG